MPPLHQKLPKILPYDRVFPAIDRKDILNLYRHIHLSVWDNSHSTSSKRVSKTLLSQTEVFFFLFLSVFWYCDQVRIIVSNHTASQKEFTFLLLVPVMAEGFEVKEAMELSLLQLKQAASKTPTGLRKLDKVPEVRFLDVQILSMSISCITV